MRNKQMKQMKRIKQDKRNKNIVSKFFTVLRFVPVLGVMASFAVLAEDEAKPISINANPDAAQVVPTNSYNPQSLQLKDQQNQQEQKQALSKGKTFLTNAPDENDPNYWEKKNTTTTDSSSSNSASSTSVIDQNRLEKQKEGFKSVMDKWNQKKPQFVSVEFTESQKNNGGATTNTANTAHPVTALAGTLWYATMAGGADSYVPGVVRIQLQEGPFAGGYALGKFQIAPDGEHLMITFESLSFGNKSFPISAVAVDPHTQVSGVTGDIDHHYMTRYVIPGAVGFLQGSVNLLKANETVVVNGNTSTVAGPKLSDAQLGLLMLGTAADSLKDATTPQGILRLPEVKLASGSGVGFLLIKSI